MDKSILFGSDGEKRVEDSTIQGKENDGWVVGCTLILRQREKRGQRDKRGEGHELEWVELKGNMPLGCLPTQIPPTRHVMACTAQPSRTSRSALQMQTWIESGLDRPRADQQNVWRDREE